MTAGRPGPAPGTRGTTLLVIAKEPVPGRVKTRLTPHYSPRQAADLAAAALADTLTAGLAVAARRRVLVLDGAPGPWLPAGYEVAPQAAGGLDARLAGAFALCDGPALLVGMDTPHLTPALLAPAFAGTAWQTYDACFGPAADGGFWALGLADPRHPELLLGVPMSTARTGALQRARLTAAGLRVHDLPVLRDVDTPQDAAEVATLAPGTRFARIWGQLTPVGMLAAARPAPGGHISPSPAARPPGEPAGPAEAPPDPPAVPAAPVNARAQEQSSPLPSPGVAR